MNKYVVNFHFEFIARYMDVISVDNTSGHVNVYKQHDEALSYCNKKYKT